MKEIIHRVSKLLITTVITYKQKRIKNDLTDISKYFLYKIYGSNQADTNTLEMTVARTTPLIPIGFTSINENIILTAAEMSDRYLP